MIINIKETTKHKPFFNALLDYFNLSSEAYDQLRFLPALLKCEEEPLMEAVQLMKQAIAAQEKILIAGDYDCDGICATTILYKTLSSFSSSIGYYIPNRFDEGYGLHVRTVQRAHEKGYTLIICVDNGVSAHEALQCANDLGIKVIIVDHHVFEQQPTCDVLVHPRLLSSYYHELSAAGLSFLIAQHFTKAIDEACVLAGICVISDVVSVTKFNRDLLRHALLLLNEGKGGVIHQICDEKEFDESTIGFKIVPLINAIGRMSDIANPNTLVRFLANPHQYNVEDFVNQMNEINQQRKDTSLSMQQKANPMIKEEDAFIIVDDDEFHEGIVGLLAGSIANKVQKPTMALTKHGTIYKGSIRSVNGYNLQEIFSNLKPLLRSFGGHALAAGISFDENQYLQIKEQLNAIMATLPKPEISYDVIEVTKQDISLEQLERLNTFRPFGTDFQEPLFYCSTKIDQVQIIKNVHLKLMIDGKSYFWWYAPQAALKCQKDDEIDLIFQYQSNVFRGVKSWQGKIIDFQLKK